MSSSGVHYSYDSTIDRTTIIGGVSGVVKTELEKQAKAADLATEASRPFARLCSESQDVEKFKSHLLASASIFALEQCLKDEAYPSDLKSGVSAVLTQYKDKIPDILKGPGYIHEWEKRLGYRSIVSGMETHRRDNGRRDAQKTYAKYLDNYCVDVLNLNPSKVPDLEDEEMVSGTASDVVSDDGQGEYTQEEQDWDLPSALVQYIEERKEAERASNSKGNTNQADTQASDAGDNSDESRASGATTKVAVQSAPSYKGKGKGKVRK